MAAETGPAKRRKKPAEGRPNRPGAKVKPATGASREGKVRKEFWLNAEALSAAQKYLGAKTERETVEMALDLVAFRKELETGARTLRKLHLSRID